MIHAYSTIDIGLAALASLVSLWVRGLFCRYRDVHTFHSRNLLISRVVQQYDQTDQNSESKMLGFLEDPA
jgi:hypothetical protein